MTFDQKLKFLIEPNNINPIYENIWCKSTLMILGQSVVLSAGNTHPILQLFRFKKEYELILDDESFNVSVNDGSENYEYYSVRYDLLPEGLFQLSTVYDTSFMEHKHIKLFKKIQEAYSLSDE